ncbi:MAG: tetratricopeptide repeat protein [Cytophagales bacterium]|nr:tetratricopeptide repeat protein [Cytophagales bacterium]
MSTSIQSLLLSAVQLHQTNQLNAAQDIYRQVLQIDPNEPDALHLLGLLFYQQNIHLPLAQDLIAQSLQIRPSEHFVHANHALVLLRLKDITSARQCMDQALRMGFSDSIVVWNFALELADCGQFDANLHYLHIAAALNPFDALIQWGLAMSELQHGLFEQGWRRHEARWQVNTAKASEFSGPRWIGDESLSGKTILLWPEQGLGDVLQFCRYAPLVQKLAGKVVLQVPRAMHALLARSMPAPMEVLVYEENPQHHYDYQTSLMSLPLACRSFTEAHIPHSSPYLMPDPTKQAQWQSRIHHLMQSTSESKPLKIGIVWAGGFKKEDPSNTKIDPFRSLRLTQFAPLLEVLHTHFFSLQKGAPSKQWQAALDSGWPQARMTDWTSDLHDWDDTAALAANMDLVISCDTSTVHLSAAIGKPTWMLSRLNGCWRWQLNREDSPWYPTLRVFAQTERLNWESVVQRVATELAQLSQSTHVRS